jgi:hypothetical protein
MDHDLPPARPVTFILRILAGAVGSLSGHIHHLRTGEKRKFEDVQELGTALLEMVNSTAPDTEPS